jgi:hypothetical protein
VHIAGITAHPNGAWVTQQARTVLATLSKQGRQPRILIRDRDVKLTKAFDAFLRSEGISVIRTPIAAPKAKANAERWVGSVRRECLDRILIVSQGHLERVLREYVAHHNTHRPHRALEQRPPILKPIPHTRPARLAFADATGSAGSCTSTNSPHSSYLGSDRLPQRRGSHGPVTTELPPRERITQHRELIYDQNASHRCHR